MLVMSEDNHRRIWDALMGNLTGRLETALEQQQEAIQAIRDAIGFETSQESEVTDKG